MVHTCHTHFYIELASIPAQSCRCMTYAYLNCYVSYVFYNYNYIHAYLWLAIAYYGYLQSTMTIPIASLQCSLDFYT